MLCDNMPAHKDDIFFGYMKENRTGNLQHGLISTFSWTTFIFSSTKFFFSSNASYAAIRSFISMYVQSNKRLDKELSITALDSLEKYLLAHVALIALAD